MTTPTPAPSGAKAISAREVVNRIAGFVITGWQSENQSKATVAEGKAYSLVQAAIDAHCAAHVAAKDRQIAALMEARKAWNRVGAWSVMGAPGAQTCRDEAKSADAACRALGLEIE